MTFLSWVVGASLVPFVPALQMMTRYRRVRGGERGRERERERERESEKERERERMNEAKRWDKEIQRQIAAISGVRPYSMAAITLHCILANAKKRGCIMYTYTHELT